MFLLLVLLGIVAIDAARYVESVQVVDCRVRVVG